MTGRRFHKHTQPIQAKRRLRTQSLYGRRRRLHQLRDLLVRVEDPVGGGTGLGNLESFALGAVPELGLTEENSFL